MRCKSETDLQLSSQYQRFVKPQNDSAMERHADSIFIGRTAAKMEAAVENQALNTEFRADSTISSQFSKLCEPKACGRLTPIVEQHSAARQLVQSRGTGFKGLAQNPQEPEIHFKKRLTSIKRSPEARQRTRTQQITLETMESDSPKGLDRALTPSMLAALRSHRHIELPATIDDEAGVATNLSSTSKAAQSPSVEGSDLSGEPLSPGTSFSQQSATEHSECASLQGSAGIAAAAMSPTRPPESHPQACSPLSGVESFGADRIPVARVDVQDFSNTKMIPIITTAEMQLLKNGSENSLNDLGTIRAQKPYKGHELVRTNISRINQRSLLGLSKLSGFEMYTMKGKKKLVAMKESGRHNGYAISLAEEQKKGNDVVIASLVASTSAENQFLLVSTAPSSPFSAFDPDHDPVIMAICFDKTSSGQRQAIVLLPEDNKKMANCPDLGSKQHVKAQFDRFKAGQPLKQTKVLTSIDGKELRNARSTQPSVKNMQLQDAADYTEYTPTGKGGKQKKQRCCFEFGKLRHNNEFVCDFVKPLLTPVQAMGLAIACSAPKRTFMYL